MGHGKLNLDQLRSLVAEGAVDTVVLAITDMQGRLQGKRCDAAFFLDTVVPHSSEGCNYLLAVDVDMRTVSGYELASWERGYGDFVMKPDLATLRMLPWHERTALCMADPEWEDGSPVAAAPRQVLRRQLDRLAERGWTALAGTELEFMVFRDSYEQAWSSAYRGLTPANQYNIDYSILGTSRMEPLLGRLRRDMTGAGMSVESVKGECNFGQHELAFLYDEALAKADEHAVFKTGAKEIAAQEGCSITFMAKFDEREGNSCHVHFSLRESSPEGKPVFAGERSGGMSETFEHFLAGQLAALAELTLFVAPNINSYKRYVEGSFAPTALAWGRDNRTCAYRIVGHGPSLRMECRVPGGDANPYLTIAALIAAGLHGVDDELELEPVFEGNAYTSDKPRVPATMADAADRFERSSVARRAFGDEVVDHYTNYARVELAAYNAAVTDWERFRGFERL